MDITNTNVVKTKNTFSENSQILKKQLVHCLVIHELFLTNINQLSYSYYVIADQLPNTHINFYDEVNEYYDAAILLVLFSQVSIGVTNRSYIISYPANFIFNRLGFRILNNLFRAI
ncbi:hypothetical protein B5S42_11760 [Gilliamella apicola]|uniref:hypothetical protein n=1 Tax=Gilliamella apicola TaxID=1196095 RepID=UPI000A33677D|nr:hypothetical protein [Gilliamella apicola]OTP86974.1 hypothetical protein B5S42_11760 [Gilliamella apicola]OTQ07738.1 hypothetical protein B6C87_12795 [Gilliamella apicola]